MTQGIKGSGERAILFYMRQFPEGEWLTVERLRKHLGVIARPHHVIRSLEAQRAVSVRMVGKEKRVRLVGGGA